MLSASGPTPWARLPPRFARCRSPRAEVRSRSRPVRRRPWLPARFRRSPAPPDRRRTSRSLRKARDAGRRTAASRRGACAGSPPSWCRGRRARRPRRCRWPPRPARPARPSSLMELMRALACGERTSTGVGLAGQVGVVDEMPRARAGARVLEARDGLSDAEFSHGVGRWMSVNRVKGRQSGPHGRSGRRRCRSSAAGFRPLAPTARRSERGRGRSSQPTCSM